MHRWLAWVLAWGVAGAACAGPGPLPDSGSPDATVPDATVPDATMPDAGPPPPSMAASEPLIDWVDPFLGTGGLGFNDIGSTFPGPQRPFGMIRPGPDTSSEGGGAPIFLHCAGFSHADSHITAFSHMRMEGTGIADYGHLGLMPVPAMEAAFTTQEGHRSRFVPGSATASPGYYAVTLERGGVQVELTSTDRVATHRYRFEPGDGQAVLLDVGHRLADGMEPVDGAIVVDPVAREVSGFARLSGGYSGRFGGQPVYFVARFDRAFASHGVWEGETMRPGETSASGGVSGAWAAFDPLESDTVHVEVAVSFVDVEGARGNLDAESAAFDFDAVRAESEQLWEDSLSRVRIEGRDERDFGLFYTALYHALQMPTLATDVDGRYRGLDGEIHDAVHDGAPYRYYTDFSLWDTYRTLHPLLTLLFPEAQLDMLRSLSAMARDGGAMPRWPLGIGYTGGMVGEPAAIVLADSYEKGLVDFDLRSAYDAMRRGAVGPAGDRFGGRGNAEVYERLGYVPVESGGSSASKTLEFAYADWALARLASALDETDDAAWLLSRSSSWQNQYDAERGFFLGRHEDGAFVDEFREDSWQGYYAEGNAWQYLWLVPHDLDGLAEQMGGRDALLTRLTRFFDESARERRNLLPPTWYWHGNEPDLHAAYIFTALGDVASGSRWSRWVARSFYAEGPRGLPGNDDGGTMSAWLVFSSLGFLPITGEGHYLLGSPLVTRAELAIDGGTFVIEAPESSERSPIVREARVDDGVLAPVALDDFRLPHDAIRAGGTLHLTMTD